MFYTLFEESGSSQILCSYLMHRAESDMIQRIWLEPDDARIKYFLFAETRYLYWLNVIRYQYPKYEKNSRKFTDMPSLVWWELKIVELVTIETSTKCTKRQPHPILRWTRPFIYTLMCVKKKNLYRFKVVLRG